MRWKNKEVEEQELEDEEQADTMDRKRTRMKEAVSFPSSCLYALRYDI